ncbi:MAG TPA: histidine kinase [Clostridiaceae bacterium]|nr:histidine kinase [Clostridiaceae bacterium]
MSTILVVQLKKKGARFENMNSDNARYGSIKNKLVMFLVSILVAMILVSVISNVSGYSYIIAFEQGFESYNQLSLFYKNAELMSKNGLNFVYSNKDEDYEEYKVMLKSARDNLNAIKRMSEHKHTIWRITLLENMLDTYSEKVNKYVEQTDFSREDSVTLYNDLYRLENLITKTFTNYYNIISQDVQLKLKRLRLSCYIQFAVVLLLIAASIFAGFVFANNAMKGITKPINEIVDNIQLIKRGEYEIKKIRGAAKELNILLMTFDEMAKSIKEHIQNLKEKAQLEKKLLEKENENLRITNLLAETKLKSLQSQINPNFLFNTLSMLSKNAYIEGALDTSMLMENLSELLRYSLEKSNKVSSIKEEIEFIKNYFLIQQKRYGNRVKFLLNVKDNLPNIKLPAMILQPLVENSLIHGVNNISDGAVVSVKAYCYNNNVYIQVEDNGAGMDSDTLEAIQSKFKHSVFDSKVEQSTNIGLYNVYKRLEMYYGSQFKFLIESERNCGTIITIVLPLVY